MINRLHPANTNKFHIYSWAQQPEYKNYLQHIPLADWLIKKYCTQWWKNHSETPEYQTLQFSICGDLFYSKGSREWTLTYVAIPLGIDAITLINDPSPELQNVI